jgi:hypothetical protein
MLKIIPIIIRTRGGSRTIEKIWVKPYFSSLNTELLISDNLARLVWKMLK